MAAVFGLLPGQFICFGKDEDRRDAVMPQPLQQIHIGFAWIPADIQNYHRGGKVGTGPKICFYHVLPGLLHLQRDLGVAIPRKVYKIEPIVDAVEIDGLGPPGGSARSSQVFPSG